jgi:hypothetical protein
VRYIPCGNLQVRVQVVDLRGDVLEGQRYEIAACIDLKSGKGGEGEVRRSSGELRGYTVVERATC